MKRVLLAALIASVSMAAAARDDVVTVPLKDVVDMGLAEGKLDGSVKFYLAGVQPRGKVSLDALCMGQRPAVMCPDPAVQPLIRPYTRRKLLCDLPVGPSAHDDRVHGLHECFVAAVLLRVCKIIQPAHAAVLIRDKTIQTGGDENVCSNH